MRLQIQLVNTQKLLLEEFLSPAHKMENKLKLC